VEAIVELASDGPGFEDVAPIPLALVTLRKPQQAITRSVTVFAPRSPHDPALTPDDLLDNLVLRLEAEEEDRPLQREIVFERPTSELLADRWNPKFYCPARLSLQDELISDPQVTWLGGVAQFIARGSHPSLFEAYIETRVAGVTFEDRQETITHLKIGDQVRLRREVDHPHDPNAVHVERRSGASVGYLPTELAAEVAEAMDDLGGEHWATVTRTQGGTQDRPTRGVTIRFAPPQHARIGEPVPMIRPSDITNNRLAGKGELVWLLHEHQEKVTRLQAGDILLFLRGFQKVCVVSREFEGAVCHRDFAIVRPNEDIDSFYLLSFILSPEFQQQLQFIARGGPLPIVNLKDLEELLVIVPPMATQRRIALAFAESQGQLGAGHREGVGRWIDLVQGDTAAERQLIYSTLLSNLFSDWDQTHTLDDWLRLKGDFVRDLRNSVAHGRSSFGSDAIDISIIALGDLNRAIEQARDPGGPVTAVPHVQQLLAEFRDRARQVDHSFLRSRLSNLASRLAELLQTESVPLPFQLSLEQAVLPAGLPALLRLSVVSESREALSELEIVPRLSSGEIIERPAWRLEWLDSGEAHAFEARVQVPKPEVVRIECAVSYTREDGEPVRRATQLMVEVVPADQVPFIPIQPNPYITGGAVDTPEMFFGRQDVLDFLSTNLIGAHQSNVIILQGNRRTGKSSILKQVVNRDLFAPHIPVFVDCQGLGALTDQRLFYKLAREIWKALAKRSDIDVPPQVKRADISEDDPFYDFQEVLDGLVAQIPDLRIILLIDEFELLDQAIQENKLSAIVLENLRHLFQHRHDLAVVLTGSYRLTLLRQEYWSILFGLGLTHKVGFLDEGAARQLVTQPLAGIVTYSEQAVDRMIELTACHPYFVQVICHNMVNVLNMERSTYVTPSNVEVAAQETLTSAGGHMRFMFDSAGSKVRQAALVYLASSLSQPGTLPSHEIEGFVESHRLPISRAELEQALRELADRDIVGIQGTMGQRRYGFKIDLVRQWIRRNYDLHSAIALAQDASYVGEG
jgi:type I restriction enzyme M protein